jgi:hypothetical protein
MLSGSHAMYSIRHTEPAHAKYWPSVGTDCPFCNETRNSFASLCFGVAPLGSPCR